MEYSHLIRGCTLKILAPRFPAPISCQHLLSAGWGWLPASHIQDGFGPAWACTGLVCAVRTSVSVYMPLPCHISKILDPCSFPPSWFYFSVSVHFDIAQIQISFEPLKWRIIRRFFITVLVFYLLNKFRPLQNEREAHRHLTGMLISWTKGLWSESHMPCYLQKVLCLEEIRIFIHEYFILKLES